MGQATTFENILKMMKSKKGDWSQISYFVFDIPPSYGIYEERMEQMKLLQPFLPSHVHVVENLQCRGNDHSLKYLHSIVASSGEGVMLKHTTKKDTQQRCLKSRYVAHGIGIKTFHCKGENTDLLVFTFSLLDLTRTNL